MGPTDDPAFGVRRKGVGIPSRPRPTAAVNGTPSPSPSVIASRIRRVDFRRDTPRSRAAAP